jgi:hypothetical protein
VLLAAEYGGFATFPAFPDFFVVDEDQQGAFIVRFGH